MPTVRVDYQLQTADADPFITIHDVVFDRNDNARADLGRDRVLAPVPGYKSRNPAPPPPPEPYWVFPDNQYVNVYVEATGQPGMKFSMTVTFTIVDDKTFVPDPDFEPYTPDTPVLSAVFSDDTKLGIINTSVTWRKRI